MGSDWLWGGGLAVAAAGGAWLLTLPTLWVGTSLLGGSRDLRQVGFLSLLSVHFGGLALLASVPLVLLWAWALDGDGASALLRVLYGLTFAGVGVSTAVIQRRVFSSRGDGVALVASMTIGLLGLLFLDGLKIVGGLP